MTGLLLFILMTFSFRTIRTVFFTVFLWQIKEYRFDRMAAHLATPIGKRLILHPLFLIKIPAFLVLLLSDGHVAFLFWILWTIESFLFLREYIERGWKIPTFTTKSLILCTMLFLFSYFFLFESIATLLMFGGIVDVLLPFVAIFFVVLLSIPTQLYKNILLAKAKKKLASLPHVQIIGITGSFGKTSTKEYAATILKEQFSVAATIESHNTEIGIARYILSSLESHHNIFLVEMGAYRRGEIKRLCELVAPTIGIVTGIGNQHLALFGSAKQLLSTKFELIESLPKDSGVALFNGDSVLTKQLIHKAKQRGIKTMVYAVKKNLRRVLIEKDGIEFRYVTNGQAYPMKTTLIGEHHIQNVLGAITLAKHLGMSEQSIAQGVAKLQPSFHTMRRIAINTFVHCVDDTFNANEQGALAAIEYMRLYKGKKILILTPLIDLGKETKTVHKNIGEKASICDEIFVTNKNFFDHIRDGIPVKKRDTCKIFLATAEHVIDHIQAIKRKDSIVLFEGKEARPLLTLIESIL